MLIRSTYNSRLRYLAHQTAKTGGDLGKIQEQITTGKRINRLSDEPWSASEIHQLRNSLTRQVEYSSSAKNGYALLSTIETALSTAMGIVQRGRELAVQGGNDSLDNDQRNGIAAEVLMMKDRLSQVVNTKFHNRYIFSGAAHNIPPLDGSFTYQGGANDAQLYVSDSTSVVVGYIGRNIFGDSTGGVFKAVDDLANALTNNDGDLIRSAIDDFSDAFDLIDRYRTKVGLSTTIIDDMEDLNAQLAIDLQGRLTSIEEVDMAEALTKFSLIQTQYEVNLQLTSQSRGASLFSRI